ncbi:MAG: radical SAM protein [Methanobrevibacter sp.]|nr:radical SAM protein [Methanobrevibacter sp.]
MNQRKGERNFFLEDYTLNPYMGCSFDCSYCYVNGSKYAKNTNFCVVKSNVYDLLYRQLKSKIRKGERGILNIGSASDPYMEIEKELFLTRDILKLANRFKFPVHIITKSDLILRDIDILKKIKENAILPKDIGNIEENYKLKVIISFSFSVIDDGIAAIFEPSAPSPSKRLLAIKKLKDEGFLVGIALMPILPHISDSEIAIDEAFSKFKEIGVDYVLYGSLTLFGDTQKDSRIKYYNTIEEHFPDLLEKTKRLFGKRESPINSYHQKLYEKIQKAAEKYDLSTSILKNTLK